MSSGGTELKLDMDFKTRRGLVKFISTVWPFLFQFDWPNFHRLRVDSVHASKTGHGYHIDIRLWNRLGPLQTIQLQALLGSDIRRENHNLQRVIYCPQMKSWNLLYTWKFKYYRKLRGRRKDAYLTLSREQPDPQLTKQINQLLMKFQRRQNRTTKLTEA